MGNVQDFFNYIGNAAKNDVVDVASFLKKATVGKGSLPLDVLNTILQKPVESESERALSKSEARGRDIIQGILMPGASKVPELKPIAAINEGKAVATKAVNEAVDTARLQPGGLQAGFIKTGGKTNPIRITLKPSVYGAGREVSVQNTIDNVVPGATATDKYKNLAPTMEGLGNQINTIIAQNPKVASLEQIMKDYDVNLQNQGIYRTSNIPKSTVQKTARQYVTDLYNEATGGGSNINPSQISDSSLLKLKQQANQDAQSVYRKIENGTSLTDKDQVILSARQTFDDTLTNLHPEIKQLTTTQSHLYDAADPLFKAREEEMKVAQLTGKGVLNSLLGKVLGGAAMGAAGGIALESKNLLPAAEVGIKSGFDVLKNILTPSKASQLQTTTNQSQNQPQAKYSIPDPMQAGIVMNQNDYATQKGALQKELEYEKQFGLPMAGITQGKLDSLDTKYNTEKPLRDKWSNDQNTGISQQLTVANQAVNAVKNVDPGFFNALQGGYDKLLTASNGKYAQMSKYLQYLGAQTGTDFSQYKTKEALTGAIDSAVQNIKDNWTNQLKSFYGASSSDSGGIPQGPAGKNNASSIPESLQNVLKPFAPGFNFGGQL